MSDFKFKKNEPVIKREDPVDAIPANWEGSTYLNSTFNSYAALADYIRTMLGHPQSTVELTNRQLAIAIDDALDIFTKYSSHYSIEYVALCPSSYDSNCGFDLTKIPEFCGNTQQCVQKCITETNVLTSVDVEVENLGCGTAMVSVHPFNPYDYSYGDESDPRNPNNPQHPEYDPRNPVDTESRPCGNDVSLTFNKNDPWNFDICDADCLEIIPECQTCNNKVDFLEKGCGCIEHDYLQSLYSEEHGFVASGMSAVSALDNYTCSGFEIQSDVKLKWATFIKDGMEFTYKVKPTCEAYPCPPNVVPIGPPLSACVNIKDGIGMLYRFKDFIRECPDLCIPVEKWWEYCDETGCSSIDLNEVTHVQLQGLPAFCKEVEYFPLLDYANSDRIPLFNVCNSCINTNGEIPIDVQFVSGCIAPDIYGSYYSNSLSALSNITDGVLSAGCLSSHKETGFGVIEDLRNNVVQEWKNTGLGINFELPFCAPSTPDPKKYKANFSKVNLTENYGTSCYYVSASTFDHELGEEKRVRAVSKMTPNGYGGFGYGQGYMGGVFGVEYSIMNNVLGFNGMGGRFGGSYGGMSYNLFDHHLMMSLLETLRYELNYVDYNFCPKTQRLRVYPEPGSNFTSCKCYVARLHVTKCVKDLINEPWVRQYALASAKIMLGRIRDKFSGVTLANGITIQGSTLISEGTAERDSLFQQIAGQIGADRKPPIAFMSR